MRLSALWIRVLLICICWYCSALSAQEILSDNTEVAEAPMSFLEFVGWMERSEDLWITPFDLEAGFWIEEVSIPGDTDPAGSFYVNPDETVDP